MATAMTALKENVLANEEKVGELHTTSWTSDGSGNYSESVVLKGWLVKVITDPGATAPTDDYDITLLDSNSFDVLGGLLTNRDTTNTEVYPHPVDDPGVSIICYLNGTYTITVANAGASKVGTIYWYLKNQ